VSYDHGNINVGFSVGGKAVFLAFLPPAFRKLGADALPERTLLESLGIWQPRGGVQFSYRFGADSGDNRGRGSSAVLTGVVELG